MKVIRLLTLMLLFCGLSSAQDKDMRGKEFWLTFPPNFHSGGQSSTNLDSLFLFIISDSIANVEIEMRDIDGNITKRNITTNNLKEVYKTGVKYQNYELRGFKNYLNSGGSIDPISSQTGKVAKQYFKVSSDQNISVIGLSNSTLSSDAFLSLPTEALGNEYIIMSYPNDTYSSAQGNAYSPSQFAILASEDGTNIEITPTTNSYNFGTKKKTITLNKGESFLMQAEIGNFGSKGDLTGSIIKSDKNIAVFSGHQRANIPIELANTNASRNMILEQLIPTKFLGKNALLVPFPKLQNIWNAYDVYRVVAKEDSTVLLINGKVIKTINKGEVYDAPLKDAINLEANSPISVAIFKQTSTDANGSNINTSRIGDPSFILVPSKEQFSKNIKICYFNTIKDAFTGQYTNSFSTQYLTIISPNNGLKSIKLDGQIIDSFVFDPIPNSEYSYFIAKVNDGIHEIVSDSNIMVYVHGYGEANAYGYFANMALNIFDKNIPRIHTNTTSFKMNGTATDTLEFDTGIYSFGIDTSSIVNCNITNDFKVVGTKIVNFSASLIDTVQDGSFELLITDSLQIPYRFKLTILGKNSLNSIDFKRDLSESNLTCSPNPTSNALTLNYSLANPELVKLSLTNTIGMEVCVLENSLKEQGNHTFELNCSNYNLQNGIYFVSLQFGTNQYITKFTLAK